jgi:copper chaperone CopZ
MKKSILVLLFIASSCAFFAQKNNSTISKVELKVLGNCESCKKRIENAADLKGVKNATWDDKTQTLKLIFRNDKIKIEEIEKAVASVGHDTEHFKAENQVYSDLPECCKYRDRACTEKGK